MLEGWRLVFRRYATIKKCEGFKVPVLIWKISEQDEKNLDIYEGYPKFYVKKELKIAVKSLDGDDLGKLTAMVYIMTKKAVKARRNNPCQIHIIILCLMKATEHSGLIIKFLKMQ